MGILDWSQYGSASKKSCVLEVALEKAEFKDSNVTVLGEVDSGNHAAASGAANLAPDR